MATISNVPRPGYVWDSTDNVWYPIGVGAHQHTNAADTPAVMPYSTYAAAGKNKILNGAFDVWQRGTSFNNNGGTFCTDRFAISGSGTAPTVSQQVFTPGSAPVSGYEAQYFLRWDQSSAATAAQTFQQRIEDGRTLAGQTATISFWAKANSGSAAPDLKIGQNFGSGGSASVTTTVQASISFTASWVRYSYTVAVPSVSGKTIGAGSYFLVYLQFPTSGTWQHDYWGFQMEAGSNATAFQTATGNPASELAACMRYFQCIIPTDVYQDMITGSSNDQTTWCRYPYKFPVPMRTTPTLGTTGTASHYMNLLAGGAFSASAVPSLTNGRTDGCTIYLFSSGITTGQGTSFRNSTSTASNWLTFSAEL
jgi:hypothetical protein